MKISRQKKLKANSTNKKHLKISKSFGGRVPSIKLNEDTGITFENWQSCVANNPEVINFLLSRTRRRGSDHSTKEEPLGYQNISRLQTSKESTWTTTTTNRSREVLY